MKTTCLWLALAGAVLVCGCGKQTQINTAEIKILSQQMVQLQQSQAKQIAAVQTQLASLGPTLDKINDFYFQKARDDALFYHTNTLFLILTVNSKIESELQAAAAERQADSSMAFAYHTNELALLDLYATQIQDTLTGQEGRIEDKVNAGTKQANADLRDELLKQIKVLAPEQAEIARRRQMEADVAQIKREIEQIRAQLGQMTNTPSAHP